MDIPPFHVLEVVRAAQQVEATGRRVLHLEVGQPSTGAPAAAVGAARASLDDPAALGYTDANGVYWQEINLQALSQLPRFLAIGS